MHRLLSVLFQIVEMLSAASSHGLEVIPLVQTFGHLEFALKLQELREQREVPYYPQVYVLISALKTKLLTPNCPAFQAICPSQDRSWQIVTQIIDQVLRLHPNSKWLHVGCDEVFQLGQCPLCTERMQQRNSDPKSKVYYDGRALFLDHVVRVAEYVRGKRREVIPVRSALI